MSLWQHQTNGVERIKADDGVHALLWQPGAGKSATVVRYLEELARELGRPIRVLIVCPKSVLGVWPQEFEKHCRLPYVTRTLDGPLVERFERLGGVSAEAPPLGFLIATTLVAYSTFSAKPHAKAAIAAVKAYAPDVIVLDEAHNIRGAQSNTSKLLGKIGQLCPRRLILTGTPTPHGPVDYFGIWRFLDPSAFAPPGGSMVSFTRWTQEYCVFGGFQGRQIVGYKDLDDLQERISRKSSVVFTKDCHTMEPLTVQRVTFKLSPAEQQAYTCMRRDLLAVVDDDTITASTKLVSVLRLRQVTSGFLPNEDKVVRQVGTTRQDLAVDLLSDLAASERRLVVFAWSRHEIDSLVDRLRANAPWDSDILRIAGDTSDRETILQQFSSDDPQRMILVAQITTLSAGTNALVGASQMLYLSLTQRTEEWAQSLARLHRPGQTSPVTARVLVAEGSVDEQILDALEGRVDMQDSLMRHIRGLNSA